MSTLDTFRNHMQALAREYLDSHGSISAEGCTSEDRLDEKLAVLREIEPALKGCTWSDGTPRPSAWVVFLCETCRGHNPEHPIHVLIAMERHTEEMAGKAETGASQNLMKQAPVAASRRP